VARLAATLLVAAAGLTACGGSNEPDPFGMRGRALEVVANSRGA
jgi:hypothetical protein